MKIVEFTRTTKITYPVLVANTDGLDLMRKLGNTAGGLPYTALLDRQGRLAHRKLGVLKQAELENLLDGLLQTQSMGAAAPVPKREKLR